MNHDHAAPEGFSPARAARLLLATAAMAFVFALPASLHLLLNLC
ncbi:hypothetical protein [Solimonas sp. K1W22B-7]|nr:hypothetical protein [Solimonas sp. K1W22B-7]